jgi:N-acetylglucosaminyldiphosphoundecaprenol N-acetyl-beta-D-mannosaminyltransferase
VNILGVDVCKMRMDEVLDLCDRHISQKRPLLLGVVNVAKVVNCRHDAELRRSVEEADVVVADGQPLVWLSRLMGDPLPERVAGIDIMLRLLQRGAERGYGVYFLGARDEVVRQVVETVQRQFPGVRIAGYRDGYFRPDEDQAVAQAIRDSGADILFVAMSSPRKENFLRQRRDYMQVPVCHGVGGSFDVVAGTTKRAPAWMQRVGLEWFYRVIQEPRRMWKRYLVTNTIFVFLSIHAVLQARFKQIFSRL